MPLVPPTTSSFLSLNALLMAKTSRPARRRCVGRKTIYAKRLHGPTWAAD